MEARLEDAKQEMAALRARGAAKEANSLSQIEVLRLEVESRNGVIKKMDADLLHKNAQIKIIQVRLTHAQQK